MGNAYTREELQSISGDTWPRKGFYCENCGTHIPEFADLSEDQILNLRMLSEQNPTEAMKRLKDATGCSKRWAKIWVLHPDGPKPKRPRCGGPPCPYCGKPPATDEAQQCFSCGKDWHNTD